MLLLLAILPEALTSKGLPVDHDTFIGEIAGLFLVLS
jgi:hypothetical protein